MKTSIMNLALLVSILLILLFTYGLRSDPNIPNYEFLPDMKYSAAYDAYSKNPNFKNGQTLQTPVVGTIARGNMPIHFLANPKEAIRAGEELTSPVKKDDPAVLSRGAEVYKIHCAACHGTKGLGDGLVTKKGYPPPPSMLTGKSISMKEGQLFHIVTYGQGSMAAYAPQISVKDRWIVVNYVQNMQSKFKIEQEKKKAEPKSKAKPESQEKHPEKPENQKKSESQK